jgi:hypothetical protein
MTRLLVRPETDQPIDLAGNIVLREKTTERLQVLARAWFCLTTKRGLPKSLTASSRSPPSYGKRAAREREARKQLTCANRE